VRTEEAVDRAVLEVIDACLKEPLRAIRSGYEADVSYIDVLVAHNPHTVAATIKVMHRLSLLRLYDRWDRGPVLELASPRCFDELATWLQEAVNQHVQQRN
jgi:hypothetical protein